MILTPAQKRALDWLPADGGWIAMSAIPSEESFILYQMPEDFVEGSIELFGEYWQAAYRLTPAGLALKSSLMDNDNA